MKVIKFQEIMFYSHPIYQDYLVSKCGKILSLKWNKTKLLKLHVSNSGYLMFNLSQNGIKSYFIHRFIFETFKGAIPKGMVIDHYDNDKKNNSISNLQILSHKENVRKSCSKKVVSFNIETQEKKIFDNLKEAKFYQIHFSTVSKNCCKISKTTKSKKDGKRYKFFYL